MGIADVVRATVALGAFLLVLALASSAAAQAGMNDPPPPIETPAVPTPSPTPAPDPASDEAPEPEEEPTKREETVPEEDEEASSDRIQYRDPLDIEQVPVKLKWSNFVSGLRGITQYSFFDNNLRFRLGGRFQADGTLINPASQLEQTFGDMSNGLDFRRFRIFGEGIIHKMYFRIEFDFAADAGFKSFYFEGREGGLEIWGQLLGKFRYGLFQEPFSLEQNMSTFDTTFVEVSMPINAIAPGSNIGAMVYDASKNRRFTWAVGAFSWGRETSDNASTSLLSLTGRFGFQPVKRNAEGSVFHLGLSFSSRSPTSDKQRYEARPEARFVPPFADTGDFPGNTNLLFGLEAAWKKDRVWAQAEFIRSNVEAGDDSAHFGGAVIQVGYFLTEFTRPWDNLFGVWGRVRPPQSYSWGNPFKEKSGGLWEVAGRWSTVDLNDGAIQGGAVRDLTFGVNWYPNSTSKFQFNWINSRVEDLGTANIWVLRYQFAVK